LKLEQLSQKLLYNSILDIWIGLCEERKWKWNDTEKFNKFIDYLNEKKIDVKELAVCASEPGEKTEFIDKISEIRNKQIKAMTLRLDKKTISNIRKFSE